jgi:hypothetical protein
VYRTLWRCEALFERIRYRYGGRSKVCNRLADAGFRVERFLIRDLADEAEADRMGLNDDGNEIFVCRVAPASSSIN